MLGIYSTINLKRIDYNFMYIHSIIINKFIIHINNNENKWKLRRPAF